MEIQRNPSAIQINHDNKNNKEKENNKENKNNNKNDVDVDVNGDVSLPIYPPHGGRRAKFPPNRRYIRHMNLNFQTGGIAMADKKQISEIDKAINQKRAELAKAQQKNTVAAHSPEQMVQAAKAQRRLSEQVQALERAKELASYIPPELSDRDELLQPLAKYAEEHSTRIRKVQAQIRQAEQEQDDLEAGLRQAAVDCDVEQTVKLTEQKADNAAKRKALQEMLDRAQSLPVFPNNTIREEWENICQEQMPGWKTAVLRVETLATEYKAACKDLLQLHDTLLFVREEIKRRAAKDGQTLVLPPVFTVGLEGEKLVVEKGSDIRRLAWIAHPLTGQAL